MDVSYALLQGGPEASSGPPQGEEDHSEPLVVAWRHVSYVVGDRQILSDVSGKVEAGEVLAILGPSGSGKTSLLNCIANRIPRDSNAKLFGEVRTHGATTAYVMQDDALFALSTVRETFDFVTRLRAPELTLNERKERIEGVIAELNLRPAADTIVGGAIRVGEARGISGGERKRCHIGCDLLHKPRVIYLDEPTSGLDSFQALSLVHTLRELARGGTSSSEDNSTTPGGGQRTVIASLHQPRSAIYNALDVVCVMAAGGRVAFFGKQEPAASHFARAGYPVPSSFNPSDHFLDVVSWDYRTETRLAKSLIAVDAVCKVHAESYDGVQDSDFFATAALDDSTAATTRLSLRSFGKTTPTYSSSLATIIQHQFLAFRLLAARGWREQTRNKTALVFKWSMNAFFSVMFGLVYFQMRRDQTSIQNRQGILFFTCMNLSFGGPIGVSQVIPAQLRVVNAERATRLYSEFAYLASVFVVNLPLECVPQIIWSAITYYMTDLRHGTQHFLLYAGILILENFTGIGLGMALSVSLKSPELAGQIAPAVSVLFLMFSGYFLNESSIPIYLRWLKYISFIRYAFQALSVNEFRGAVFSCEHSQGVCVRKGGTVLKQLDFDKIHIVNNAIILAVMIFGFNILALLIFLSNKPKFLKFTAKRQPIPTSTTTAEVVHSHAHVVAPPHQTHAVAARHHRTLQDGFDEEEDVSPRAAADVV